MCVLQACASLLPMRRDNSDLQRASNQSVQPPSLVAEGLAPTVVAERVSDDDDGDVRKFSAFQTQQPVKSRDGYCQCDQRAMPSSADDVVDRTKSNRPRDFRPIQHSTKLVPRPLRSASVDRWSRTSVVKCQPISGGASVCSRYSNGSSAYRVSTPTDLKVLDGRTSRRERVTPPARDGRPGWDVAAPRLDTSTGGWAPHAAVDSDLASDLSDLDQDIVDDFHRAESVLSITRQRRSGDSDVPASDNDRLRSHENGWTQAPAVTLRRSSAQEMQTRGAGTPRSQRAGSYHGSVHHSVTMPTFPTSNPTLGGATRASIRSALASLAGRWSKSGRKASGSKTEVDDRKTAGCGVEPGSGLVSRIVARASCRLPKSRSKSGERCSRSQDARTVAPVCGGRVTVSAASLSTSSSIYCGEVDGAGSVKALGTTGSQLYVPYIDDSEPEGS